MPDVNTLPGAQSGPEEQDENNSDSDVTSVSSDDFESYFREENGRQFHSHGIYPLPVDDREVARAEDLHEALKHLIGGNFVGPVNTVLAPVPPAASAAGVRRRVLDLCTGSGLWVDEMADEFPHARFYGIDMVPIMNRYPADNVQFEMGDVMSTLRWESQFFDLVHARFVTLAVHNYPRLLEEVGRVMKPGGLFISGEWRHEIFHPTSSVEIAAPNAFRFFQLLRIATQRQGIPYNSLQIADFIRATGLFEEPHTEEFTMTFGNPLMHQPDDPRLQFRASVMGYGLALKHLFLSHQNQMPPQEATNLVNNFLRDIDNVPGLRMSYVVVYARRL